MGHIYNPSINFRAILLAALRHVVQIHRKGYRMVPFNLKVLTKFGLCSNCSQKLRGCSLARARKIFASARMLACILVNMVSIARNFVNPAL